MHILHINVYYYMLWYMQIYYMQLYANGIWIIFIHIKYMNKQQTDLKIYCSIFVSVKSLKQEMCICARIFKQI